MPAFKGVKNDKTGAIEHVPTNLAAEVKLKVKQARTVTEQTVVEIKDQIKQLEDKAKV
jgi:hypothetical protein